MSRIWSLITISIATTLVQAKMSSSFIWIKVVVSNLISHMLYLLSFSLFSNNGRNDPVKINKYVTTLLKTLTFPWLPISSSIIFSLSLILFLLNLCWPSLLLLVCTRHGLNSGWVYRQLYLPEILSPWSVWLTCPNLLNHFQKLSFSMRFFCYCGLLYLKLKLSTTSPAYHLTYYILTYSFCVLSNFP